ncbi:MAG: DUF4858 domain-containing protein [Parabacteroides sp.]
MRGLCIYIVLNCLVTMTLSAQQDSLVVVNGDTIRLRQEVLDAIREGRFLQLELPPEEGAGASIPLRRYDRELPILIDFSDYVFLDDSSHRRVALRDLPPSVFWRHWPKFKYPLIDLGVSGAGIKPASTAIVSVTFDAGELTSRKSYVYKRNQKRNATLLNYNNLPTSDVWAKQKAFRTRLESRKDTLAVDSASQIINHK